jgi:hypothetical protein
LAVNSFLTAANTSLVGRDGGFWAIIPQVTTKTNDKLRRQRGLA